MSLIDDDLKAFNDGTYGLGWFDDIDLPDPDDDLGDLGDEGFQAPDGVISTGYFPGEVKYCIHNNKIFEGCTPMGKCVANIDSDGRIYEGVSPVHCIANIGDDGRIYEGPFLGKCIGCIIDGKIYLGGYFPQGAADYNIS